VGLSCVRIGSEDSRWKWQPKSRHGQFLGFSKQHASTIGLIRNIKTGSISPQFHVVFDDSFTTVPSRMPNEEEITKENWERLLMFSRMLLIDEEDEPPELDDEWLSEQELQNRRNKRQRYGRNQATQTVRHQIQEQEIPEAEEVPDLQIDSDDSDDDNDDDDQGDYWQPRHQQRRWVPNRKYFGDQYETQMNLNPEDGYTTLLNDFGLLTNEEAFIANLGGSDGGPKIINSQA
jgi:hypothetical protein